MNRSARRLWRCSGEVEGEGQGAIQLRELARGQGGYEGRQLALEHQGEKVTADGRHPGKAFLWTNDYLRGEPEHLAVNRSTNHGRHVVILGDERAGAAPAYRFRS